jgi:hypothetical protein
VLSVLSVSLSVEAADLAFEAGSPFVTARAQFRALPALSVGPRLDLLDGRAIRPGLASDLIWLEASGAVLGLQLTLARSFGLSAVDTWDLDLVQDVALDLDEQSQIVLRAGALFYMGPEATQSGVLALGALRLWRRLQAGWRIGFELGWIGDRFVNRPMGGISIAYSDGGQR